MASSEAATGASTALAAADAASATGGLPPLETSLIGIAIMAVITYAIRASGVLIGPKLSDNPEFRTYLEILPGCAMASVAMPSFAVAGLAVQLAAIATIGIYLATSRTMVAMFTGLAIAVSGAHLGF